VDPLELLQAPMPAVSVDEAARVASSVFGIDGVAVALGGERDRNFLISSGDQRFSLKVAHPAEGMAVLEMQAAALSHIAAQDPDLSVPGVVYTSDGGSVGMAEVSGIRCATRMLSYLPGEELGLGRSTARQRHDVAVVTARLDRALRGFFHPAAGQVLLWDVTRLPELRPYLHHVGPDRLPLVERIMSGFEERVVPVLGRLRSQPIHNDVNPDNLLVDDAGRISGVIDFSDMVHAAMVMDPAIAIAYQCPGQVDVLGVITGMAASYHGITPLEEGEMELLPDLVAARLVQSLVIGAWRSTLHPSNSELLLRYSNPVWEALRHVAGIDRSTMIDGIRHACGLPSTRQTGTSSIATVIDRRKARFGPGMRLSYDEPLHLASAEGVWLIDTDGNRHLDAYNNVPHVGHGHPVVVAALAQQAAILNTNTRYAVDGVLDYADRLVELFPDELSVVYFTNSGSEANDLAWRIARTVTGREGAIVTRNAYHGSTALTMATSPEELGIEHLAPWVATVPAPDTYRGIYAGHREAGRRYAEHIEDAVAKLASSGHAPAFFACDTVLASDGIFDLPAGYLLDVYEKIRTAGGVCIADEVQAGFGRVGSRMWGFAGQGVVPDIVTVGKPIGNGHPMAAVITTPSIASAFDGYFFSTFGGNPVSAAVGIAVLDVMEAEGLVELAERVGTYLRSELRGLNLPAIGDVRGPGMFIGIELVDESGGPDAAVAAAVVNEMRRRRVLIGRTGLAGNVLKVRPPLPFDESHADRLAETLGQVLVDGVDRRVST